MINKEVALTSRKLCKQSCSLKKTCSTYEIQDVQCSVFSTETKIPCKDTSMSPWANGLC